MSIEKGKGKVAMSKVKKFLGMMMAALMCFALTPAAAFAATLQISDPVDGHTYKVYQMLKGDVVTEITEDGVILVANENGTNTLSNVEPGESLDRAKVSAVEFANTVADGGYAAMGKTLSQYVMWACNGTFVGTLSTNQMTIEVENGYYLVADELDSDQTLDQAISAYMIGVVGNRVISPKNDAPTLDKAIVDSDLGSDDVSTGKIGEDVTYTLTATLGSQLNQYTNGYSIKFVDTLSDGLTFNRNTIQILKNGNVVYDQNSGQQAPSYITIDPLEPTQSFNVTIDNVTTTPGLEAEAGDVITVRYTAQINEKAVVGGDGNTNKAHLEYTNNPNDSQSWGSTPEDIVRTYVTKLDLSKVDGDNNALPGAWFLLSYKADANGDYAPLGTSVEAVDGRLAFENLKAGYYKLEENTTPPGYNTIEPIEFHVTCTVTGEGINAKGTFGIEYLVDGNWVTNAPQGWGFSTTNNVYTTTVVNLSGTQLPSTGGAGTTVLYVIGALLVIGAVVLLVRRRSSAK